MSSPTVLDNTILDNTILDNTISDNTNLSLPTVQSLPEGNFEGRRVINTTEEINKILKVCDQKSNEIFKSKIKSVFKIVASAALCFGSIALTFLLAPYLPSSLSLYPIMCLTIGSGAFAVDETISLFSNKESKENNLKIQSLSNDLFLDWAENEKIQLEFSNVYRCYNTYVKKCEVEAELNLIKGRG